MRTLPSKNGEIHPISGEGGFDDYHAPKSSVIQKYSLSLYGASFGEFLNLINICLISSLTACACWEFLDALTRLIAFTQLNRLFVRSKQTPSHRLSRCRIWRQNLLFRIHDGNDVLFNLNVKFLLSFELFIGEVRLLESGHLLDHLLYATSEGRRLGRAGIIARVVARDSKGFRQFWSRTQRSSFHLNWNR